MISKAITGYADKDQSLEHAILEAERYDCDVVIAKLDELQLDFDDRDAYWSLNVKIANLERAVEGPIFDGRREEWPSKSATNCHVVLGLCKCLPAKERIALQLMLGSDPWREMNNYARVKNNVAYPIRLFKPRPKKLAGETK